MSSASQESLQVNARDMVQREECDMLCAKSLAGVCADSGKDGRAAEDQGQGQDCHRDCP